MSQKYEHIIVEMMDPDTDGYPTYEITSTKQKGWVGNVQRCPCCVDYLFIPAEEDEPIGLPVPILRDIIQFIEEEAGKEEV